MDMLSAFARRERRLRQWLAGKLATFRTRGVASLAAGAVIGPEGIVQNPRHKRDDVFIGAHSRIRGRLLTYGPRGRIEIGQWCYVGPRSEIWSMDSITIGDRVLVAHDVNIHDGTAHSLDPQERTEQFRHIVAKGYPRSESASPGVRSAPVVIEDDAWISFGVTILKGVRIGAGSVIAAGSIVTRDVPPGVLYRCEFKPVLSPLDSCNEPEGHAVG